MNCPDCGNEVPEGAACPKCSESYAKWVDRKFRQAAEPGGTSRRPKPGPSSLSPQTLALISACVLGGFLGLNLILEPSISGETLAARPIPGAPVKKTGFNVRAGFEEAVEDLSADFEADQEKVVPGGTRWSFRSFYGAYRQAATPPSDGESTQEFKKLKIGRPATKRYSGTERRNGTEAGVRCLVKGEWRYGPKLPVQGPDAGVEECWERRWAEWKSFLGSVSWGYRWEKRLWHPKCGAWRWYSEEDERRLVKHVLDTRYSDYIVDGAYRRHMMRARARMDEASTAGASRYTRRSSYYKKRLAINEIRNAHMPRVRREAVRHVLRFLDE